MQRRMSTNAPERSGYRIHMLEMRMPPFDPLSAAIRLACVTPRFYKIGGDGCALSCDNLSPASRSASCQRVPNSPPPRKIA
ncbi:hypothetical protein ABMB68_004616 [Bradyrhizobium sp. RT4a]